MVSIGFYRRVWEGDGENISRKGWKSRRRKHCVINEIEWYNQVKIIYIH